MMTEDELIACARRARYHEEKADQHLSEARAAVKRGLEIIEEIEKRRDTRDSMDQFFIEVGYQLYLTAYKCKNVWKQVFFSKR